MIKFNQGQSPFRIVALAAIGFALAFGQSQAANITDKSRATGMMDAPALIQEGNIPCELADANYVGESNLSLDGKTVKGKTYEIACKNATGWIVTKSEAGLETPYNCTQGNTYALKNKGIPVCALPLNAPHYAWLQADAKTYVPDCVVNKARLVGTITTGAGANRYEVGCANAKALIVDIPLLGSKAPPAYRICLMTEGTSSVCEYQTHEQAVTQIVPIAQKADPACQANNARFIGTAADSDSYYFEIGCSNQPGFVILVKSDNSLDRTVSCTAARALGGCQFTKLEEAASVESDYYTKTLTKAGYGCTVQEFNIIGSQPTTKRDYAEFKCPEKPFGLIGFVPQDGSNGEVNVSDCFVSKTRKNMCSLIDETVYKAHIDKLIKVAQPTKGCDVSDVRYVGESGSEAEGVIVEVACVNKRGYIGTLSADRTKIVDTIPCRIAKTHKEEIQCEIPGNGTYADNE
jgi:hypothetical protein